jgi:hypothetical protein
LAYFQKNEEEKETMEDVLEKEKEETPGLLN